MESKLEMLERIFDQWSYNFTNVEIMRSEALKAIQCLKEDPEYHPNGEDSDAQCILLSIIQNS